MGKREVGDGRQRRSVQGFSVTVLGLALACAPMAVASAHSKKHHPKPKHHSTKVVKAGLNPGSKLCVEAYAGDNSSAAGSALEKAMVSAETSGNWTAAKQALDSAMNASLKEESGAEAALRSAPANVQAAMKNIFSYVQSFETAINNSSSFQQFATSMETLVQNSAIQADSTTLANYLTQQCGPAPAPTTTTTSVSIP
jgi:cobalamin biosynthesis Mg chelatase CobN